MWCNNICQLTLTIGGADAGDLSCPTSLDVTYVVVFVVNMLLEGQ